MLRYIELNHREQSSQWEDKLQSRVLHRLLQFIERAGTCITLKPSPHLMMRSVRPETRLESCCVQQGKSYSGHAPRALDPVATIKS